jgi:hypothetical protein
LQEMLEVPGILLILVTLWFYLRHLDRPTPTSFRAACIAGITLFFAKFNYAIQIMVPILACELLTSSKFRLQFRDFLLLLRSFVRMTPPFAAFVAVYAIFLGYIQFFGVRFEVFGQLVLIERALGNPTYLLILICLGRALLFYRRDFLLVTRSIWRLPEPFGSVIRCLVIPAMVWLSYPLFFSNFFGFLFSERTRKQAFLSSETLLFYPGAIVERYAAHRAIGVVLLLAPSSIFL